MASKIPDFPLHEKYIIDVTAKQLEMCKELRNEYVRKLKRCLEDADECSQIKFYIDAVRNESNKSNRISYLMMQEYILSPDSQEKIGNALAMLRAWLRSAVERRVKWSAKEKARKYKSIYNCIRNKCRTPEDEIELFSVLFMIEKLEVWYNPKN